jgi:hypothetical protein
LAGGFIGWRVTTRPAIARRMVSKSDKIISNIYKLIVCLTNIPATITTKALQVISVTKDTLYLLIVIVHGNSRIFLVVDYVNATESLDPQIMGELSGCSNLRSD